MSTHLEHLLLKASLRDIYNTLNYVALASVLAPTPPHRAMNRQPSAIAASHGGWHGAFYLLCGPAVFYADIMRAKKKREDLLD